LINQGIGYWLALIIGSKISFCNIGRLCAVIDQDMIPGFVFGWIACRHLLIPFVRVTEDWVDIVNNPAISKSLMFDDLANMETGTYFIGHWSEPS
jgi:hypothetical protein